MSSPSGMNNLTTLIKRLEAATSRLEDIAQSTGDFKAAPHTALAPTASPAATALSVPTASPQPTIREPPAAVKEDLPASVVEFDTIVEDDITVFEKISKKLGDVVAKQSVLFAGAFRKTHDVLLIASKSKEPDQSSEVYRDILKPLGMGIEETVKVRDTNRGSPQSNQLNMLAEGAGVLAWVQIKPRPDEYVGELLGGAQMYGNRILKEFKESDPIQVDWVRAFVKCCGALKAYIKDNHPRGLVWNNNGVAADVALRQVQSSGASAAPAAPAPPAPAAGGPPPPPPPMPAAFQLQNPQAAPAGGDMGAVFADLNRGESVTAGLKKVDKSEMTHKNPALRAQGGDAPVARGKSPAPARKPETLRTKKPSRKEFEANKWLIENFDQADMPAGTPIEINAEKQHSVLISRCKNVTIRVNGKANAISLDNCSRVDLLVDSLVSALDVINTSNFRAQVLGTLPSVQLDKVDSGIIFLSKDSLDCQVFTSKCSSINITLPPASEADDSVECPIPEQMVSYIKDGQMVSEIVKQEG